MLTKGNCKCCQQFRIQYRYGICQNCYRDYLEKYKYRRIKKEYENDLKQLALKHREIIKLSVNHGLSGQQIANALELQLRSVNWAINKYTFKCDIDGNPKPKLNKN